MALGWGAGLAVWSVGLRGRWWRFEQSPDWSVLYAELPLALLGGTAGGLALWAVLSRLGVRVRRRLKSRTESRAESRLKASR